MSRHPHTGIIDAYRQYLSLPAKAQAISLHEGNTPLIRLNRLSDKLELNIYAKFEGLNPTASFKDRGMSVAVSQAVHSGSRAIICASTGNTSAAAAAYAARANIDAYVIIPKGNIAMGKLAQAMMYGAKVLQIAGNFDEGLMHVKALAKNYPMTLVNSINPFRIEGQKTAAFEIIEALDDAPDYHCLPVGNAGNITAYWRGYSEFFEMQKASKRPVMLGYQAEGSAPIVHDKLISEPETIATAIRIGNPQSWSQALEAQKTSGGWFDAIGDEAILKSQQCLAESEGVFCEPASAISIAGLSQDVKAGRVSKHSTVVCTLTGHGLKDPEVAINLSPPPETIVDVEGYFAANFEKQ